MLGIGCSALSAAQVEARLNVGDGEEAGVALLLAEDVYGPFSGQVRCRCRPTTVELLDSDSNLLSHFSTQRLWHCGRQCMPGSMPSGSVTLRHSRFVCATLTLLGKRSFP